MNTYHHYLIKGLAIRYWCANSQSDPFFVQYLYDKLFGLSKTIVTVKH